MIQLFRKNLFLNSLLLLLYVITLRIDTLINPIVRTTIIGESYLSKFIKSLFSSALSQSIFSILVVYFCTLLINRLVIKNKLTKELTLIPGLVFVLLTSLVPESNGICNALLGSVFIIGSFFHLYSTYNNNLASSHIFLAGFYAGISGIFYFPLVYLVAVIYLGFLVMRSFIFKEKLQLLLGWLASLILVLVWQYWIEEPLLVPKYFNVNAGFHLNWNFNSITNYFVLATLLIFTLMFFVSKSTFTSKKATSVQKKIGLLFWLFAFACLSMFLFEKIHLDHLYIVAIPSSILFAMKLINMKNRLVVEIIHLFILLVVFIIRFNLIQI